jgi:hypothetical protein
MRPKYMLFPVTNPSRDLRLTGNTRLCSLTFPYKAVDALQYCGHFSRTSYFGILLYNYRQWRARCILIPGELSSVNAAALSKMHQ